MRTYSGVRHRRLAMALPSSTRMPCSVPERSTNCSGGSVGLTDISSVPFFTSAASGTGERQSAADTLVAALSSSAGNT